MRRRQRKGVRRKKPKPLRDGAKRRSKPLLTRKSS
jgi:hypothetical protein